MTITDRIKAGWVAIMKAGTHRAMNGKDYVFSEADLDQTAAAYDPALSEAPCVIGHPELDAPAYGWAERLERDGEFLWAKSRAVAAQFAEWVRQGFYRKISAAFYPPETSPVPGVYYLRHIGFLGAAPPAVKGLPQAAFAAAGGSVAFEEPMPILDELQVQEQLSRLDEVLTLFWDQIWQIRWSSDLPDKRAAIVAKVNDLAAAIGSLNFSEEETMDKPTFLGWLKEGLRDLGLIAPAPPGSQAGTPAPQFSEDQVRAREQAAADKATVLAVAAAARTVRATAVHAEVAAFVDAGIAAGTFLPVWKEAGIPAVLEQTMLADSEVTFAEGKPPRKAGDVLMEMFRTMGKIVPLGEHAPGGALDPEAVLKAEFATGKTVHDQMGVTFETWKKTKATK